MKEIDFDPSCRLPLSSKGYHWLKFLENSLKVKKVLREKDFDQMALEVKGKWGSPKFSDIDLFFHYINKGSYYRLLSPDLDCLIWQRKQTIWTILLVRSRTTKRLLLFNQNI